MRLRVVRRLALAVAVGGAAMTLSAGESRADSCWDHNGSTMRLVANGSSRTFIYEAPRSTLRRAGVRPGTVLFTGRKVGNRYVGQSRVFSRHCPGNPLVYDVSGPISGGGSRVTVSGSREVHQRCTPTGRYKSDTLVFTYAYDC